MQIFLSVVLIAILIGAARGACAVSSTISQQFVSVKMSPFSYAEYNISTLAFGEGLSTYSTLFGTAISYEGSAALLDRISSIGGIPGFVNLPGKVLATLSPGGIFNLGVKVLCNAVGLSTKLLSCREISAAQYDNILKGLTALYLDILTPIIMLSVGVLFIQYISLPFLQYLSFTVILPISIMVRMLPFGGRGLRRTANFMLALAIAFYIVYPTMIGVNSYISGWIFGQNNPLYPYVSSVANLQTQLQKDYLTSTPSSFLNSAPQFNSGPFGLSASTTWSVVKNLYFSINNIPVVNIFAAEYTLQGVLETVAKYAFRAIFLYGIDLFVTIGFASSLAKGLNGGIEEAAAFWGGL